MTIDRAHLEKIDNFDDDRGCFACGEDNPFGLHMTFYRDGQTVRSWLNVPPQLCGWRHIVHGGIVSTILDETMSWTAHHQLRKLILTKSIAVTFRKLLHVAEEIEAVGWVRQINSEREAVLESRIVDGSGSVCAQGVGTFALLTPKIARRIGLIEEGIIQNFERFLTSLEN